MGAKRAAMAALLMGWMMTEVTAAETKTAPYGTWASPITAARLAGSEIRLGDLVVDGGVPYWLESRPAEKGRYAVVTPDGAGGIRELTGPEVNARTRVHEYGGGALLVSGGRMYFSNFSDQRLYTAPVAGGAAAALTPPGYRYADCVAGAPGHLYCVREDHSAPGEAKNAIVSLAVDQPQTADQPGDAGTVLFGDSDFVAYPRPSPDGRHLAWIAWSHPNMPWDTTTLYVATVTAGGLTDVTVVAGGHDESVMEPRWDADGTLYFLSDRSDWWNLYAWSKGMVRPVTRKAAEFGGPLWNLGQSNYALTGDGHAMARYGSAGVDTLAVVDLKTGAVRDLSLPFVAYGGVTLAGTQAVMMAYAADQTPAVISVDLATGAHTVLRRPAPESLDAGLVSRAKPIEFPTAAGPDGQARTAHAFYYAPTNPGFRAPAGEKPPLLVKVHGGPTSASKPALDLNIQYWTSRGFAVVDVNYGGSTGYGRAYRNRLRGNWGVTDVQDATAVVAYLDQAGLADANRAAIRGGSAGGYTTLAALAFTPVFKAGANYYGVSDMESLAKDTHKFESRYLDSLVAPYPAGKAVYDARSPLHHLDGFSAPLITFQGAEDAVVPPAQSRSIVAALKAKGVPVAYIEFEGEQHGFRKADSIIRAQEAELYFYGRIFGFTPADTLPAVAIDNLK
ncbi:prolyl oligopeptidase family serine peptidase [Azospirillum sp. B4]|uniref:S9 family peptidase n=1 Tax=Azospirillum sp. B4 TaxID=95605 RepID=UPI000346DB4E|nr:prolyl oligopeptidase family serine peptidase [Azospirillum sp. B4]